MLQSKTAALIFLLVVIGDMPIPIRIYPRSRVPLQSHDCFSEVLGGLFCLLSMLQRNRSTYSNWRRKLRLG